MAEPDEIETGKAYILTTVEENQVEKFDIKIEKINRDSEPSTKSMVIRVTDDRLIEKSGGIIQGMSGKSGRSERKTGGCRHSRLRQ